MNLADWIYERGLVPAAQRWDFWCSARGDSGYFVLLPDLGSEEHDAMLTWIAHNGYWPGFNRVVPVRTAGPSLRRYSRVWVFNDHVAAVHFKLRFG